MKKSFLLFFGMFCLFVSDAGAARPSMSEKMMAAPRAGVASKNQISAAATLTADEAVVSKASLKAVKECDVPYKGEKYPLNNNNVYQSFLLFLNTTTSLQ